MIVSVLVYLYYTILVSINLSATFKYQDYHVEVTGVDKDMIDTMKGYSLLLLNFRNLDIKKNLDIQYMSNYDSANLTNLLKSMGYRDALVSTSMDLISKIPKVYIYVWLGPMYHIGDVSIHQSGSYWPEIQPIINSISNNDLEITIDKSNASTSQINLIRKNVIKFLHNNGLPLAKINSIKIFGDRRNKKINLKIEVDTGPKSYFGNVKISGNKSISEKYIRSKITWIHSSLFNKSKIYETRSKLLKTQLFKEVFIEIPNVAKNCSKYDNLPILITVKESHHRNIKVMLYVDSNMRFFTSLFFEHKNIDSSGGIFEINSSMANDYYQIYLSYIKNQTYTKNQSYLQESFNLLKVMFSYLEKRESRFPKEKSIYNLYATKIQDVMHLQIGETLSLGCGLSFEFQDIKPVQDFIKDYIAEIKNKNQILTISPYWSFISSNVISTEDWFFSIKGLIDLSIDFQNQGAKWIKLKANATVHTNPIFNKFLLHTEIDFGIIIVGDESSVPINKRFYLGGTKKPRGYAYDTVSPYRHLDKNKTRPEEPYGGFVFYNTSLEMWYALKRHLAILTFLDIAQCFEKNKIDIFEDIFYSYGIGFVYTTNIGMYMRCDIGIPLSPRKEIDYIWQAYISIGNYVSQEL